MKASVFTAKVFLIGAVIGCVALFIRNQNAIAKLTTANQKLLTASQEVKSLVRENQEIARLRPLNDEAEKLREGTRDLPKLRNEIRVLRDRFTELKTIRLKNEQLLAQRNKNGNQSASLTRPEGFLAKAQLSDAGLGSPESAVQTYFWAMSNGDVSRFYESIDDGRNRDPNGVPLAHTHEISAEKTEKTRKQIVEEMEKFPGYRIAETKMISAEEVEVALQSTVGGVFLKMTLKRIGNDWKVKQ